MKFVEPGLVVTVPKGAEPLAFARRAQAAGADFLEIRNDLTLEIADIGAVAEVLPVLVARRTQQPLSAEWIKHASIVDQDISLTRQDIEGSKVMLSMHADRPLDAEHAVKLWRAVVLIGNAIKHVEPFEAGCEERLLFLRRELRKISPRVTVLAMGPGSQEVRRLLSHGNSLQYCALDEKSASAPGQPLLVDEVRRLKRSEGSML